MLFDGLSNKLRAVTPSSALVSLSWLPRNIVVGVGQERVSLTGGTPARILWNANSSLGDGLRYINTSPIMITSLGFSLLKMSKTHPTWASNSPGILEFKCKSVITSVRIRLPN